MILTHAHLNTEQMAKFYLQSCVQLERQAHYAVWNILYHRLTFILFTLHRSPCRGNWCHNCKAAPPSPPNSHISTRGLMGMDHSVTLLPCIQGPEARGFKRSDVFSAMTFIWDKERCQDT